MDDKLIEVKRKIMGLGLHDDPKFMFLFLIDEIDLPDNKIKTFLGYLFRLVISNAYKYGVPSVYIKECLDSKKSYQFYLKYNYSLNDSQRSKITMYRSYNNLLIATLQLIKSKKSRKEKISQVLEKIANKNN